MGEIAQYAPLLIGREGNMMAELQIQLRKRRWHISKNQYTSHEWNLLLGVSGYGVKDVVTYGVVCIVTPATRRHRQSEVALQLRAVKPIQVKLCAHNATGRVRILGS